jgi:hypothetical protein
MVELASTTPSVSGGITTDPRVARSKPDVRSFALLVAPLALLLILFWTYRLEQTEFLKLACIVFGGFAVSYWLPFRFKQLFFILLSLAGAVVLLGPLVAGLLIASGLLIYTAVRTRLALGWKVALLLSIAAAAIFLRASGYFEMWREFWPVFGAIFAVRTIVYVYDVQHAPGPPRLKDFLSYFYLLPNYLFMFFPVIDYQTFQRSYFKRHINEVAQQGVWWIFRGTTHLLLYRLVYQAQGFFTPPQVPVPIAVAGKILLAFPLYLHISGQFHISIGMLHLFGYDLPETNHRYFLAKGITELWRRANIYWKDFMVKIVYMPAYFKLRRKGEFRAQLLATGLVFPVTWFLHAWLFFMVQNRLRFTVNDAIFWTILGGTVVLNVLITSKRPKPKLQTGWKAKLWSGAQIVGTFLFVTTLWSMWSAQSISEWLLFLKTGSAN